MYLIDSNVFIEAQNRYYRSSFFPSFWTFLEHKMRQNQISTIGMVYQEIIKIKDPLSDWAKQRKDLFIHHYSNETQQVFSKIADHIATLNKNQVEKDNFLSVADPMLIAYAKTNNLTLVTHEKLLPPNTKKISIPNICQDFDVQYCDTFEMLENLKPNF